MRSLVIIWAMVAALSSAQSTEAQTTDDNTVDTLQMFREAALGYCAERVLGQALISHDIDPFSADWVGGTAPEGKAQSNYVGRSNLRTHVLIEPEAQGRSCLVSIESMLPTQPTLNEIRAYVAAVPGTLTTVDNVDTNGRGTVQELGVPEVGETIPMVVIHDSGPDGTWGQVFIAQARKVK